MSRATGHRFAAGAALVAALLGEAGAKPPCAAAARVSGDAALVGPVVRLLGERGLDQGDASGCGAFRAVLARDGARVRLIISDPDGRTVERLADDVDAAATIVESWARRDVAAPLLAGRAPARAPSRSQGARRVEVAAAADAGLSDDGALWAGARAQGCIDVGPVCVGAVLRYVVDTGHAGQSAELGTSRSAFDILLQADVPLRWRRVALAPGAGAGITAVWVEDDILHVREETGALTLRAHFGACYRIAGTWSIAVDVAAGYAPFAPTRLDDDGAALAGVPRLYASLGVGLAFREP